MLGTSIRRYFVVPFIEFKGRGVLDWVVTPLNIWSRLSFMVVFKAFQDLNQSPDVLEDLKISWYYY